MTIRKLMRPRPFLEGVVFSHHFPTPSVGVENAHPRYRHQRTIFAVNLPCTPSEGVVFSHHFPTPSEGVENAHPRYRHQRTIFAVNLPCTPSEGVVFPRHFPTPSEGVVDAHLRCGYQESCFNEFTSGCTLFFNCLKISGL